MADKVATYGVKVDATSNAGEAANSVDALRKRIEESQAAIKRASEAMRGLRGDSEEVRSVTDKLKASKAAERDAISKASLALVKQGTSYAEIVAKEKAAIRTADEHNKKLEEQKKKYDEVKKKADEKRAADMKMFGPLKSLVEGFSSLSEKLSTTGGLMSLATTAAVGLAGAVVALGAGLLAGAVKLGSFILESGNALRTMGLFREAATGSEANAKAFGHQIEALGDKLPQTRAELQELSVSVSRSLVGTRLTGEGIVDTFKAVAGASAAMGDSAGGAIQSIVERSKTFGRLSLGLNELQGTGLQFTDVASALAKNLKIGNDAAQMQLRMGLVNVNAGAQAIKDAVEKRFGSVNAKRMLDLNVIAAKFHDRLAALTRDINLEPILRSVDKLAMMFDRSTVTGEALKGILERFADAAGKGFEKAVPIMQEYFETAIIYSLKFEIALRKLDAQLDIALGDGAASKVARFLNPLNAIELVFKAITAQVEGLSNALAYVTGVGFGSASLKTKTDELGKSLGGGVAKGVDDSKAAVAKSAGGLGKTARDKLTSDLQIHSPSKVFAGLGKHVAGGFAEGVADGGGGVAKAVGGMAGKAVGAVPGSGAGGGGGVQIGEVHVSFPLPNVKDGASMQAAISAPEFRAALKRALAEALVTAGG